MDIKFLKKIEEQLILLSGKLLNLLTRFRQFLYYSGILRIEKVCSNVISVGNLSCGGEGKTPITIKIAENLKRKNINVAVILRGYKRKSKKDLILVSDGKNIFTDAIQCGDEPYLIAQKVKVPVIVSKNRVKACNFAIEKFNPKVIILDDAFQHFKIYRDKDIVLVSEKTINSICLLREEFYNLSRADTVIITKVKNFNNINKLKLKIKKYFKGELFNANFFISNFYDPVNNNFLKIENFKFRKISAFCGIANPDYFKYLLEKIGLKIENFFIFRDHCYYNDDFYKKINSIELPIITTEKDFTKIDLRKIKNKNFYVAILELFIKKLD